MKNSNIDSISGNKDKTRRLKRLNQLLRYPQGHTLKELLMDEQMDDISERNLRSNLREFEEKFGAEFTENLYRGRERLWRYKDTNFSIFDEISKDVETIRKSIERLDLFKGDPQYEMLRFYLLGLENGIEESEMNFMSFDNNRDVEGLDHIERILDAITKRYPLKLVYKPFNSPKFESNIHPYHLRQFNGRWYLFAYSEEKKRIQNYALDRIEKLSHLSKPYVPTDIDFDEYFDDIVGVTNYQEKDVEKIIIKVDKKSLDYILSKPIHGSQKVLKGHETEHHALIQLDVKINTELKMLLFSYNDAIEVVEPEWLREDFAQKIKNLRDIYQV